VETVATLTDALLGPSRTALIRFWASKLSASVRSAASVPSRSSEQYLGRCVLACCRLGGSSWTSADDSGVAATKLSRGATRGQGSVIPRSGSSLCVRSIARSSVGKRQLARPPYELTSASATAVLSRSATTDGYSGSRSSQTTSHDPKSWGCPAGRAKNQMCRWAPPSPMR
jgi:hypothetical protein